MLPAVQKPLQGRHFFVSGMGVMLVDLAQHLDHMQA